jgi:hypothetical protein
VGKPEGKRQLGSQDVGGLTILKCLRERGWDGMDRIGLA